MKVAIFGLSLNIEDFPHFRKLLKTLEAFNAEILIEEDFAIHLKEMNVISETNIFNRSKGIDRTVDLLISVGGDGTMLRAITYVNELAIPLVGLNTGRLGFLSTCKKEESDLLVKLFHSGAYSIEERSLVQLEDTDVLQGFVGPNYALNEITLSRKDTTSMITVDTYLDGEFLTSYWADGLLISTPTGSTGYSLSCGGPVISPLTKSLVLTPIAPHNLNARPLVIDDETEIRMKVSGREEFHLVSLDSRIATIPNGAEIVVKKAAFKIHMVVFHTESFLKTLRNKLLWGQDARN